MAEVKEVKKDEVKNEEVKAPSDGANKKPFEKKPFRRDDRRERKDDGLEKKLVKVGRVVKVTKGGKIAKFNALVVAGDKNGKVGIGTGKALETPSAIEKATVEAKRHLQNVNIVNGTIPHKVIGCFGASRVVMLPAAEGKGVIAGGSARAILETCGIKNITCKSYGSRNKVNTVRATLDGLMQLRTKEQVEAIRAKQEN